MRSLVEDLRPLSGSHVRELVVVAACLAMSLALGLLADPRSTTAVIVAAGAAATAAWALRFPGRAMALVAPALLLLPPVIPSGGMARLPAGVPFVLLVVGAWAVRDVLLRGRWMWNPGTVAATALLLTTGLSLLAGQLPWSPAPPAPLHAQVGGAGMFWISCALFLACANLASRRRVVSVTTVFLASGTALIALRVTGFPGGTEGASGSMFWVWLVSVTAAHALFAREMRATTRWLLGLVAAGALLSLVAGSFSWVSGWLPAAIGLAALLVVGAGRWGIALVLAVAGGLALVFGEVAGRVVEANAWSLQTRLEAWRIIFDLARESPLLGLGPANYYHYTSQQPILGWYVSFSSHNQYLDVFAQIGLLGLLGYAGVLAASALAGYRLVRVGNDRERIYGLAVIGGLAGTVAAGMLGDWVVPFLYNTSLPMLSSSLLPWIFCGLAVGLAQRTDRR